MTEIPTVTVEATPIPLRREVLALLQMDEQQVHQLLNAAAQGRLSLEGLFHARCGSRYVGAAWGQLIPGRTAFTWPPRLVSDTDEQVAVHLQRAVDQFLAQANVSMAQAILADPQCVDAQRLLAAGYQHFADLEYLVCPQQRFPLTPPALDVEFKVVSEREQLYFAQIIEATYINTLDCTNLGNARSLDDTLEGYRMTGQYRPDWWLIARCQGRVVGCLVLADHAQDDQCELVYMGVVPDARGQGWGAQLVTHALWLAASHGRQRVVLAVDRLNWPARSIYTSAGFQAWTSRSILLRRFASA